MNRKRNTRKVRDLVEMLQDPDSSGYIGSDRDTMELYEQELEEMDDLSEGFYDGEPELDFN